MDTKLSLTLAAGAALLCAITFAQEVRPPAPPPQGNPPAGKTGTDSKPAPGAGADAASDLEALKQKQDALALEVAQARLQIEKLSAYVIAQAEAAKAMEATLAEAERKGFAVGENFDSRRVLLAGWREQLSALQQNLPEPPGQKKDPNASKTGGN